MRRKLLIGILLAVMLCASIVVVLFSHDRLPGAPNPAFGHFTGPVQAEFVDAGQGGGREMRLLSDLTYVDPKGVNWTAEAGYQTDGASIPKAFWSLVGSPFSGSYRKAAVIHDWYCATKERPWKDVHRVFHYANRAAGIPETQAKILYTAVRIGGPKWGDDNSNCNSECHSFPETYSMDANGILTNYPAVEEQRALETVEWVRFNNPSLEEIETYVSREFPGSLFGH